VWPVDNAPVPIIQSFLSLCHCAVASLPVNFETSRVHNSLFPFFSLSRILGLLQGDDLGAPPSPNPNVLVEPGLNLVLPRAST
jgi:hypothetical protein